MKRLFTFVIILGFIFPAISKADFNGFLKADTSATLQMCPFLDSTDGDTEEGALTISQADVRLSKNGGNFAQKNEATACTYDEVGCYSCPIDATDTNTEGRLKVVVHESGALLVEQTYMVQNANVYDSLYAAAATDYLQVDAIQLSGDGPAADNSESFFDGTGYPGTNNVIPTVTTLTGHTPQTADHTAAIADIPTVAEFNARTLVAASYFDPAADAVANVTLVATTTTNTDMRGTDNALLAASAPTNFSDLAITVTTGQITVGTNNDKTGYTASTVSDKTGYSLAADQSGVTVGTVNTLTGHTAQTGDTYALANGATGFVAIDTVVDSVWDAVGTSGVVVLDHSGFQKGEAVTAYPFPMIESSDNVTLKTDAQAGLRTAGNAQISKDGGAYADLTNIATINHIGNGTYEVDLTATEMNADTISLRFKVTGSLETQDRIKTSD